MRKQSNLKRKGVRPGINKKRVKELYFGRGTESNPKISPIADQTFVIAVAKNKAGYHCWESDSELDELIKHAEKRALESTGKICNAKRALESAENIGDAKRARVCVNIGESTDSSNYDAPAETSDSDTVKTDQRDQRDQRDQTDQEEETDAETSDSDSSDSDSSDSDTDQTDQEEQEEETDAESSDSDTDKGDTPPPEIQDEVRSPTIGELFSASEQMTGSPAPVFDLGNPGTPGTPATPVYLDIFEGIPGLAATPTEPQEFSP